MDAKEFVTIKTFVYVFTLKLIVENKEFDNVEEAGATVEYTNYRKSTGAPEPPEEGEYKKCP